MIAAPAPEEVAATTSRTADLVQDLLAGTPRQVSITAAERQWHRDRKQARERWLRFQTDWSCQYGRYNRRGGCYALPASWKMQMNAWHAAGLSTDIAHELLDDVMMLEAEALAVDESGVRSRWATFLVLVARTIDHLTEQAHRPQLSPMQRLAGDV